MSVLSNIVCDKILQTVTTITQSALEEDNTVDQKQLAMLILGEIEEQCSCKTITLNEIEEYIQELIQNR